MKKVLQKIAIIGHGGSGTTLASALMRMNGIENVALSAPKNESPLAEYRKVKLIQHPLSEKQLKIVKAMQNGAVTEYNITASIGVMDYI